MQLFTTEPTLIGAEIYYIVEEPLQIVIPEPSLEEILQRYCICDISQSCNTSRDASDKLVNAQIEPSTKRRKRCIEDIDFSDKILLLTGIIEGISKSENHQMRKFIIKSKRKLNFQAGKKSSRRRSNFIGVSKNGTSHQVLISIEGKKTYLGCFESEIEAAVTFDFYCILLHSVEAKTNFSYTTLDLREMIHNFKVYKSMKYFYPKVMSSLQME